MWYYILVMHKVKLLLSLSLIVFILFIFSNVSNAAVIGGYGAVNGNSGWAAGGAPGRELIDKTNTLSAGTVRSASVYFASTGGAGNSIRIKVWRQNGLSLDLVGESGSIDVSNHAAGVVTVNLPTPIVAQAGDYPGVFIASGNSSNIDAQSGAYVTLFKTTNTTSGSVLQSSFGSDASALTIQLFDTGVVTVSDYSPLGGYNDDSSVAMTINGSGFVSGVAVKLTKSGQADINATGVVVVSSSQITASFDLNGVDPGSWNLIVTNSDTGTVTASSVFKIRLANQTTLGGYGAVDSNSGWSAGGAPGRDFIDKTNTLSAGTVRSANIFFSNSGGASDTLRIKVWRQNGTNLDLVGESGSIDVASHAAGLVTVVLPTPIVAEFGDYPGIFLPTGTSSIDGPLGAYTTLYKSANLTSGSVAQSTFSTDTTAGIAVEFFSVSSLTSVSPTSAVNTGTTSLTIVGGNFQSGATVKFTKSGQSDINATDVVVVSNTQITANINLTGAQQGSWSVVVTNTDTSYSSLTDGFLVTSSTLLMGIGDSIAEGHPLYHGPEHTGPSGNPLSQIWLHLQALNYLSYYNAGIGGDTANGVNNRLQALLDSQNPDKVYLHVGINDIATNVTLETYLSKLDSILTKVVNAGAELIVDQIIPDHEASGIYNENIKIWNAAIENWALTNSIKLAPTYLEMSSNTGINDDEMLAAYSSGDIVHPTVAGYTRMGTLVNNADVPLKKRVWGSTLFPLMSYDSIRWFVLAGGSSISGNGDTGSIILPQNGTAVSNVLTLPSGSKPITIVSNTTTGSAGLSYRTSANNFARSDPNISWIPYVSPVTIDTDQFIQIKITGTSVADATVEDITLHWTSLPEIVSTSTTTDSTSASVLWTTNILTSSIVDYGITTSYGTTTSETDTSPRVTDHTVALSGLSECTTYHFRIKSYDAYENLVTGDDATFTTYGCSSPGGPNTAGSTTFNYVYTLSVSQVPQTPKLEQKTQENTSTEKPAPIILKKDLKTGTVHAEVKLLQIYLNTHGYTVAKSGLGSRGQETSRFGRATRLALIKFQKDHKITTTGMVGPKTRAAMAKK